DRSGARLYALRRRLRRLHVVRRNREADGSRSRVRRRAVPGVRRRRTGAVRDRLRKVLAGGAGHHSQGAGIRGRLRRQSSFVAAGSPGVWGVFFFFGPRGVFFFGGWVFCSWPLTPSPFSRGFAGEAF